MSIAWRTLTCKPHRYNLDFLLFLPKCIGNTEHQITILLFDNVYYEKFLRKCISFNIFATIFASPRFILIATVANFD